MRLPSLLSRRQKRSSNPCMHAVSIRDFIVPENQEKLTKLLGLCVLPKKGKLDGAQREHESSERFKDLRRRHAAVESGINALEHHGLDRVLDYGLEGFERYVALSIVARNIQLLGRKLQEKELGGPASSAKLTPLRGVEKMTVAGVKVKG